MKLNLYPVIYIFFVLESFFHGQVDFGRLACIPTLPM